MYNLITILGPTASGKTAFAAHLAMHLETEIISADSRQVYRNMTLGTGKDYEDYCIEGVQIPYHLIDLVDAGTKYNVYEFQKDFLKVFSQMQNRGKVPVLCGGSGLYLEAVLDGYHLIQVPVNESLRKELESRSMPELENQLSAYKSLHNTSDCTERKRLIRAIEIAEFSKENNLEMDYPNINSLILGVSVDVDTRRERITNRLKQRLENGMIDEVKNLMDSGVSAETLIYYGLEYKFITQYLLNSITYQEMFEHLNIAIHQFAKRQMTWFRKMERSGKQIHWIDGTLPMAEKVSIAVSKFKSLQF